MPGSVSGVFSLKFIVFVMPVSVSEFVSLENHARHYENNKISIKNTGNVGRHYGNNEINVFCWSTSDNCGNCRNSHNDSAQIKKKLFPTIIKYDWRKNPDRFSSSCPNSGNRRNCRNVLNGKSQFRCFRNAWQCFRCFLLEFCCFRNAWHGFCNLHFGNADRHYENNVF